MRRAHKVDANQVKIVKALRAVGCSVVSLAAVGAGVPDLLVGFGGANYLIEIKDGDKPPSERKLTQAQLEFHGQWRGHVSVASSVGEALLVVGLVGVDLG